MQPQSSSGPIPAQYSPPTDAPIENTKSPEATKRQLEHAIVGTDEVLAAATAVFPFSLFPDTVTLDRSKLSVTRRIFFGMATVVTMRVEDILTIDVSMGPIFGTIKITSRILNNRPYEVRMLTRSDALRVKRITQGYIIALRRHIDCSTVPAPELAAMLEQLGTDSHGA